MFVRGAYLGILFVILGASLNLVTAQGKNESERITPGLYTWIIQGL